MSSRREIDATPVLSFDRSFFSDACDFFSFSSNSSITSLDMVTPSR